MYYATMPTDALRTFRDVQREAALIGFDKLRNMQRVLGERVRSELASRGVVSVAAPGFQAPTVVVSHTADKDVHTGKRFVDAGIQIASGVPLKVRRCLRSVPCPCRGPAVGAVSHPSYLPAPNLTAQGGRTCKLPVVPYWALWSR